MNIKFGTDGWRGRIADDFTFENVARVMQAFSELLAKRDVPQRVYLGYDSRFLSREFAETAAEVMTANGIEVHLAKQFCPTPCVSWMIKEFEAGAGVMITASHNPYNWNGIKFKEPGGYAASVDYTDPVEQRIRENFKNESEPLRLSLEDARRQGMLKEFDPLGPYVDQLRSMVDIEAIRAAGWHIVVDSMYGAGAGFIAAALGNQVREVHADSNPSFGLTQPEPLAKNLGELMEIVSHEGIDIGLATDGDADRIGAVDENGNFVDSHHIFALLLKHLVEKRDGRGEVVKTVSTTQMIDLLGKQYGLKVHQSPIGFKHICAKFREVDALIGGEESGGIALVEHIPERDGVLCGLLLLEVMTQEKKSLGRLLKDLADELGPHYFRRDDLPLSQEQSERWRDELKDFKVEELAGIPVTGINRMDGCRLDLNDGSWVLIRPSGTEPLLRLYAEASSQSHVEALLKAIRQALSL